MSYTIQEETRLSADGSTPYHIWEEEVRDELLNPADMTNQATRTQTIEYLEVQCVAELR